MNIARHFVHLVTCAALSVGLFTATANAGKPKFAEKADSTIVDFATEVSGGINAIDESGEDFDILIAALVTTGVVGIFDGTDYTVFAPTDQAFYDLATAIRDDDTMPPVDTDSDALGIILGALTPEDIAAVLAYHVTEGVRNSRSVTRAKQIEMLDENTLSGRTMPGFIEANNSIAELENIDNRFADGMVHVIDTVLLP